jgi:signal transduction histidine kinase
LALALLLVVPSAAAQPSPPPPEKRVLLLLPSDTAFPWTAPLSAALRATLEQGEETVLVFSEEIDVSRFNDPGYPDRLQAWLAEKYRSTPLDLIVAPGPQPLAFLDHHAPPAWQRVPVVALHNPRLGPPATLAGGITGYASQYELRATVEEAMTLVPGTRRVAAIWGASADERERAVLLMSELRDMNGIEILALGGLRLPDLLARLRALPPDAIVLFLGFRVDGDGRSFLPERALAQIAGASPRPVFGVHEPLVGHGLVGGRVASFEQAGVALAALSARVLGGERAASIPFTMNNFADSRYDARELARWGIDVRAVPAAATVINREETLFERYRWSLLAIVAAFLVQAALIGALLVERERRRRAESKARRSLGQLAHLDRVAAMGELATSLAHELNQPLAAILANAQAARRLLAADEPDLAEVRASLDDIVDDDKRAGEVIRRMRALLKKDEFRPEPVDLNDTVRNVTRLLAQDAARRGVAVDTELSPNLAPVRGDAVQLQQVVLNLLVNAFDAVARCPAERRRVVVRTREQLSGSLELSIEDAGDGIPGPHLGQLFEPFFTTKAEGLGMGLSITRSILELHGGEIVAQNLDGGGASFRCVLPRYGRGHVPAESRARAA